MALSKIQLSELLQVYGEMLTDKQREALTMYCDCDCTLSEIASEQGISRQGVRDAIVKSEATLLELEEALHLAKFTREMNLAIQNGAKTEVFDIAKKFVGKE